MTPRHKHNRALRAVASRALGHLELICRHPQVLKNTLCECAYMGLLVLVEGEWLVTAAGREALARLEAQKARRKT